MKKFKLFLLMLLGMIASVTLVSCDNDKDYIDGYEYPFDYKDFIISPEVPLDYFCNTEWKPSSRRWKPGSELNGTPGKWVDNGSNWIFRFGDEISKGIVKVDVIIPLDPEQLVYELFVSLHNHRFYYMNDEGGTYKYTFFPITEDIILISDNEGYLVEYKSIKN